MSETHFNRRDTLFGGLGAASLMAAPFGFTSDAKANEVLKLDQPGQKARIRAKIMGSTEGGPVYSFLRIHIYGYRHDGNLIPFYTMNNLNIRRWSPQPDGSFKAQVFECGTYSKFDTEEPLEEWENPITGERIKPWTFVGGPLNLMIGADGEPSTGAEATVKPKGMNFQVIGDTVFMLQASAFSYPNPFQPAEWPKESSGERSYWDSHYLFAAKLSDVLDPNVTNTPAVIQLQNLVSWGFWSRMGQTPGRSWGRGFGTKIKGVDEIPAFARADLEKKVPQIFDLDSWTEFIDEVEEYKRAHKPG